MAENAGIRRRTRACDDRESECGQYGEFRGRVPGRGHDFLRESHQTLLSEAPGRWSVVTKSPRCFLRNSGSQKLRAGTLAMAGAAAMVNSFAVRTRSQRGLHFDEMSAHLLVQLF